MYHGYFSMEENDINIEQVFQEKGLFKLDYLMKGQFIEKFKIVSMS